MNEISVVNWKRRTYMVGGAIGLSLGLLSAYLLIRAADERGGEQPRVKTGEAVRLGLSALGLIRQIAAVGDR